MGATILARVRRLGPWVRVGAVLLVLAGLAAVAFWLEFKAEYRKELKRLGTPDSKAIQQWQDARARPATRGG